MVLNFKRLERYRQKTVERIVNVVMTSKTGVVIVRMMRRCDLKRHFPKVLFAAVCGTRTAFHKSRYLDVHFPTSGQSNSTKGRIATANSLLHSLYTLR